MVLGSEVVLRSSVADDFSSTLSAIARLSLAEVEDVRAREKGKSRATSSPSDEQLAFQLFADEAQALLRVTEDEVFARSLDSALDTDRSIIEEFLQAEAGARADREMAVALSEGRPPPRRSSTPALTRDSSIGSEVPRMITFGPEEMVSIAPPSVASSSKTGESRITVRPARVEPPKRENCVICTDTIKGPEIRAPCGHYYDQACLIDLFRSATTDESLFPPRCCQQPFILADIRRYLSVELSHSFERKSKEFNTPDRVYCHRQSCSAFLGPTSPSAVPRTCSTCHAQTCGKCKGPVHFPRSCPDDADDAAVLALAEEAGWKRCPGCRQLVELTQGCYHMTCRCRKQFCYVCTETWKTCNCPQWDETLCW
ncbi:hypothetical protein B0H21DRAFT_538336 [Amylocystis lapponica]|nr:hypothetical protein B0H21DRAFT_538336 [Amylocystis lapponica]